RPAGTGGYDDLLQGAERYDLEGLVVPVASLPDVMRSKKTANRPKDHAALDTLQELLRRIKRPTSQRRLDPAPLTRSPPPGLSIMESWRRTRRGAERWWRAERRSTADPCLHSAPADDRVPDDATPGRARPKYRA